MLTLTSEHIEQVRKYFEVIAQEGPALEANVISEFLLPFAGELKNHFLIEPGEDHKLVSICRNAGAQEYLDMIKDIQSDYYSNLALLLNKGGQNSDIEALLKNGNSLFAKEVSYQLDIQKFFFLDERRELKKKFQEIENQNEIKDLELRNAFMDLERRELKERFKEIDNPISLAALDDFAMVAEPDAVLYAVDSEKTSKQLSQRTSKRLNRGTLAIAASIVGAVAIALFFVMRTEQKDQSIAKQSRDKITSKDSSRLRLAEDSTIRELLADNRLKYDETRKRVLKEQSFGFSEMKEEVTVRLYVLDDKITRLQKGIIRENADPKGPTVASGNLQRRIDSLNALIDKYTFDDGVLSVYRHSATQTRIYKVGDNYYIKLDNSLYNISSHNSPASLNKVRDRNMLRAIERIDFESN